MPLIELMESVATIAGAHGVGRADLAELRRDGRMSRELRESPALTVLRQAHESLARLTTGQEEATFRPMVSAQYTQVMRDGCWFSPFRQALDAYVDIVERRVSGTVRLMLFKGESRVVGRRLQGYDQPLDATVAQAAR
jgi:argininosuccinate synthase